MGCKTPPPSDRRVALSGGDDTILVMKSRVLVVDDDPALSEMLSIVLRGEGFDTAVVADGSRALPALRELKPDLVLLDLMLPGMNGIDVCNSKASRHRSVGAAPRSRYTRCRLQRTSLRCDHLVWQESGRVGVSSRPVAGQMDRCQGHSHRK